MDISLYLLCLVVAIVFGVVIFSLVTKRDKKKNATDETPTEPAITAKPRNKKPGWQGWLMPLGVALILGVWSIVFALFFLAIVWVMRLDPKIDSKEIPFPSDLDRNRAKGTYTWLLVSPILNVIIFAIAVINLDWNSSANERVVAALVPLIIHLPVLAKLVSKSPFVFRHTQQAVFFLALRASMAALALNISKYPDEGIWLFLLGNGFLWLFGSIWGRNQAHHGTGWWIKQKGETILAEGENHQTPDSIQDMQQTPEKHLEYGKWYLKNNQIENARTYSLKAFRTGNPDIRSQALHILSQLGEVEKF